MKRILVALLLLLIAHNSMWADRAFVEEGKTWAVVRFSAAPSVLKMMYYKMMGDTVINDKTWKKVYSCDAQYSPRALYKLVREEGKKYYYLPINDELAEECLLADFSLQVGQTALLHQGFDEDGTDIGYPMQLLSEETVNSCGYDYHVVEYGIPSSDYSEWFKQFDAEPGKGIWIEGIGEMYHVFTQHLTGFDLSGIGDQLLECRVNGELIYHAPKDFYEYLGIDMPQCPSTYHPFVLEGRTWNCVRGLLTAGRNVEGFPYYYTIQGDTIIQDKTYKKVYVCGNDTITEEAFMDAYDRETAATSTEGPHRYYAALREEGRKVFCIRDGKDTEELLYHFDAGIVRYDAHNSSVQVGSSKVVPVSPTNDIQRRVYSCGYWRGKNKPDGTVAPFYLAEGIGHDEGDPFNPSEWQEKNFGGYLITVYDGEVCTFDWRQASLGDRYTAYSEQTPERPFVEEGKYWRLTRYSLASYTPERYTDFKMEGDTIVGGLTWKKFYTHEGSRWKLCKMFRQDGTKVYTLPIGRTEGGLLMDSGLDTGEAVPVVDWWYYEDGTRDFLPWQDVVIVEKAAFKNLSEVYRRYTMRMPVVEDGEEAFTEFTWIEGIGNSQRVHCHDLATEHSETSRTQITECRVGDELIYMDIPEQLYPNYESLASLLNGIGHAKVSTSQRDNATYDLQGRLISTSTHKGIFIQDGKKVLH